MENEEESHDIILGEILSDVAEVRSEYIKHFESQAQAFATDMAKALIAWRPLDTTADNEKRGYIAAMVYTAIGLHVQSMQLVFAGQLVAAGNPFRQVVECIALALLCSPKIPFRSGAANTKGGETVLMIAGRRLLLFGGFQWNRHRTRQLAAASAGSATGRCASGSSVHRYGVIGIYVRPSLFVHQALPPKKSATCATRAVNIDRKHIFQSAT